MKRRTFLTLLAGTPAAASFVTACGSDTDSAPLDTVGGTLPETPPATDAPVTTEAPDTEPPDDAAAPDDDAGVVIEYGVYGGMMLREVAFQRQPILYITTDGQAIVPGVTAAVFPGPLVPPSFARSITPAGIEAVVAAAREAGLAAEVDYSIESNIADAGTTTVVVTVDGTTYTHEAYALGSSGGPGEAAEASSEVLAAREALAAFTQRLVDLDALAGSSELGPEEPYQPDAYQVQAVPAGDLSSMQPTPTVIEWPSDIGFALADATECMDVEASVIGELVESSDQLTFFTENDETYQVLARPAYPGRSC